MAKELTPLERIKQLDEERARLLAEAKGMALKNAEAAIAELNGLGFNYALHDGSARGSGGTRKGTRSVKDEPCKICGYRTSPPHDARSHRTQPKKKPFTDDELAGKGLSRV